jgi:hypothetical protein
MPDSTPTTVVAHRYGALTYISLGFNVLILLLILIGIVCHPHMRDHRHGGWGGGRFEQREQADRGDGDRFGHHDFGGMRQDDRGFGDRDGRDMDPHDMGPDHRDMDMGDRHDGGKPGPGPGGPKPDFGAFAGGMDHFKPMNSEEMTDHLMLALDQKLTLTDAESAQIRPLVQDDIAQFQKDMEAQKAAHQKMIEDAKAKVRAVLTPDQQKQFDAMTAGFGAPPAPAAK